MLPRAQLVVRADVIFGSVSLNASLVPNNASSSSTTPSATRVSESGGGVVRISGDTNAELVARSTFERNVIVRAVYCADARFVVTRAARLLMPRESKVVARVRVSRERDDAALAAHLAELDRSLPGSCFGFQRACGFRLMTSSRRRTTASALIVVSSSSSQQQQQQQQQRAPLRSAMATADDDGATSDDGGSGGGDDEDGSSQSASEHVEGAAEPQATSTHPFLDCTPTSDADADVGARCIADWRAAVPAAQQVFVRHAEALRRLAIALGYGATPLNASGAAQFLFVLVCR